ncbi:MAG TPA: cytochrome c-type biogenesis protein CcmH [Terriglobales bacterium]|nr:cytochrome c-type biogenesis protein CcmH [Terriglobales bacterium]
MTSSNRRFREGISEDGRHREGRDFSRAAAVAKTSAALAAEGRRTKPSVWLIPKGTARRTLHALILTAAVFLFMGAGDDSARFKDLGHRMMCTCGCGQVLLECNHVGCQSSDKMRNQLQAALDKGGSNSDDLILQGFVQEYGPTVIAAPTATGFNRVAWIMPFVALALGIAFVVYVVRAWKNRPEPALADGITIPRGSELDEFCRKARRETDL